MFLYHSEFHVVSRIVHCLLLIEIQKLLFLCLEIANIEYNTFAKINKQFSLFLLFIIIIIISLSRTILLIELVTCDLFSNHIDPKVHLKEEQMDEKIFEET